MSELLVAFSGKMRSGKSTIAEVLRDQHGFTIISIGSTIKKVANLVIEQPDVLKAYLQKVLTGEKEEALMQIYVDFLAAYRSQFMEAVFEKDTTGVYIKNESYRKLTQMVATYFRDVYSDDIWMRFIASDAMDYVDQGKNVVCDDLRLKSEKRLLEMFGFTIVRLDISNEEQKIRSLRLGEDISDELLNHPTEVDLDDATFDVRILVDGLSSDAVYQQVVDFLKL